METSRFKQWLIPKCLIIVMLFGVILLGSFSVTAKAVELNTNLILNPV